MKEIIDSQTTRQIQPVDFSFLSDADKDIVLAFENTLRTMYGWANDAPIVLSGLELTIDTNVRPTRVVVSDGTVVFNGVVYPVEGMEPFGGVATIGAVRRSITMRLTKKVVQPSPVFDKNLSRTIECHYEYYGQLTQGTVTPSIVVYDSRSTNLGVSAQQTTQQVTTVSASETVANLRQQVSPHVLTAIRQTPDPLTLTFCYDDLYRVRLIQDIVQEYINAQNAAITYRIANIEAALSTQVQLQV